MKISLLPSRFISVSSGEDLASKGRELEHHFRVHGTPIMIGEEVQKGRSSVLEWATSLDFEKLASSSF